MSPFDLKSVLDFLSALAANNRRDWFAEHKGTYEGARQTFEEFIEEMIRRLSAFEDLSGLEARDCILRIYRDTRFSKDKTPYNTSMTALIAPGGRKSGRLGFGLRLAPNDSGAAGGLWSPSSEQLSAFRSAVDRDGRTFSRIIEAPEFVRIFGGVQGEKLKTAPQGYAKDHPAIELLRLKEVYAVRAFTDQAVLRDDFADQLVETYLAMKPFVDFLNSRLA